MKTILALLMIAFALEAFSIKPKIQNPNESLFLFEKTFRKSKMLSYTKKRNLPKNTERYLGQRFSSAKVYARSNNGFDYYISYHAPILFKNPYGDYEARGKTFYKTGQIIESGDSMLNKNSLIDVMEILPAIGVSDYSDVVSSGVENEINNLVINYSQKTGVNIRVLTIPTLGKEINPYDYIQYIFDTWGIGLSSNTILVLIITDDEKLGVYTTGELMSVLKWLDYEKVEDRTLLPLCRDNMYSTAVLRSIKDLIKVLGDKNLSELKSDYRQAEGEKERVLYNVFFAIIAFFIAVALFLLAILLKKST